MAKSRIKGITIEIGADTTPLQKALRDVDKSLKDTQTSLKDVNKLLKLDPSNTELLRQKQALLKSAIDDTSDRLKTLKDAYAQLDGNASEEAKQQQAALAREIAETEQNLKSLKGQYKDFGSVAKQQLGAIGDKMKEAGENISSLGKDLSVKLTAPLVALGTVGVNFNAQMEQYQVMFTTLTGSAEEADRVIKQLQADAQESPFNTSDLIQANQYLISAGVAADDARKMIKNLGNAVAATGGGNDELNRMAQNLQQIKNVGKASQQDIKQFANAGINIYGLLAKSMGKTVKEVKDMEISYEDLAEAFAEASEEGGDYANAMSKQSKTLTGSLNQTKEAVTRLLGEITRSAMPIIVKVLSYIKQVIDRLSQMDDRQKRMILIIGAVIAAIGPALMILGTIITTLGIVIGLIAALSNPIGMAIAAIGLFIVAIKSLISNMENIRQVSQAVWQRVGDDFNKIKMAAATAFENIKSTISDKISSAYSNVVNTFDNIKNAIVNKLDAAKNYVASIIDKIKNLFSFSWSLPHIKLPHFRVDGSFGWSWNGGLTLPHIYVDWYKKAMNGGMILNSPTIFGMMDGKLLGAGEAGSETVVGTNSLMNMIREAVGSSQPVINMTVNGGNISANELAGVVIDRLRTEITRNNNRW